MKIGVIDALPIALLALFVFGMKPVVPLTSFNSNYNSIITGKNLRGLLAITVIFHHLALRTTGGILFHQFTRVGFLAVAMFFFFSGYGLQKSYIASREYRKHFLLHRIPPVLFPYVIVTALFWIMYAIGGRFLSVQEIILAIINGSPIVSFSWYIINILIFYIVFWFLMILFGSNYNGMIVGACVWYVLYAVFCIKIGYASWWYNASQLLIVGMFWATYEGKIEYFVKKHYRVLAPLVWVTFLALFLFRDSLANYIGIKELSLILIMMCAVFFVLTVLFFTMKFEIGNPVLAFLGKNSLEIYLVQGLFITGLRNNTIYIQNEALWSLVTVLGSVALGAVLHYLLGFPLKKHNNRT